MVVFRSFPGISRTRQTEECHWAPYEVQYLALCKKDRGISLCGRSCFAVTISGSALLPLLLSRSRKQPPDLNVGRRMELQQEFLCAFFLYDIPSLRAGPVKGSPSFNA